MINRKALFSDETEVFKKPYQPCSGDRVTLVMRTLFNDATEVYAVVNGKKHAMKKRKVLGVADFDYFEYHFTCHEKPVHYHFDICDEADKVSFNRLGCVENAQTEFDFRFVPNFKVPTWALSTVFYQIYTDRFYNGEPKNDVESNEYFYTGGHSKKITDWNKVPETLDVNCFYGGDLQGVKQKLSYLKDLGVEAIYFNPLFVSPSNHKYDTQDYDHIDPHLAIIEDDDDKLMEFWEHDNSFARKYVTRVTSEKNLEKSNEYFANLVSDCHANGIRVIVDGVFNHCGSFNKWLDKDGVYKNSKGVSKGAFHSVTSPYASYFKFNKPMHPQSGYEGWWGFDTLPKLNYEHSKKLENYILATGAKWVSAPYNADGWRLDVAADLGHSQRYNHKFWKAFRESVRAANGEAFIFAEHYGDPGSWFLTGKEWDSIMNYDAFMEPLTWFLTGMEKHSEAFDSLRYGNGKQFFDSIFFNMSRLPRPSLDSALNQLSNHDHSRFLTRTNQKVGNIATLGAEAAETDIDVNVFKLAVLVQFTWPGSPGIYYGDEAGQVGWTDPDSRRTYPWGRENTELIAFHKGIIALRNKLSCLKLGSIKRLDAGNGYIAYGRFNEDNAAAIIVNCFDTDLTLAIPVWEIGVHTDRVMKKEFFSGESDTMPETCEIKYGRLTIKLPKQSGCVYSFSFKEEN